MVRAPCCEKMGLKRGPWTPEEDHILVSYIQRYGHGNWRALPKQAGLLRCGKSCRLRWTNYLRPDIRRGNFTREEEETIINLHELLGNRWSAIAAKLPGRTDNEIKNVWHTHLKKRLVKPSAANDKKQSTRANRNDQVPEQESKPAAAAYSSCENLDSPPQSSSDLSYSATDSSIVTRENTNDVLVKEECTESSEQLAEFDDSFWTEALSFDTSGGASMMDLTTTVSGTVPFGCSSIEQYSFFSNVPGNDDSMDFWLKVLMEAGDLPGELPTF